MPVETGARAEDVVEGGVDVGGDEEVLIAVAVGVEEDRPGGPAGKTGRVGDPLEGAVAAVAVEDVGAEVADEEVGTAVAVGVPDGDPGRPAVVADARRFGDVLEGAVAAVAVEVVAAALGDRGAVETPAVDQVEVEVAVGVVVEERDSAAARFEDVRLLLAAAPGGRGEARLAGDVDEPEPGVRGSAGRPGSRAPGRLAGRSGRRRRPRASAGGAGPGQQQTDQD